MPHLNYGIITWGYKCDRIKQLQKKAIRIVSLSKYNAITEPIKKNTFTESDWYFKNPGTKILL